MSSVPRGGAFTRAGMRPGGNNNPGRKHARVIDVDWEMIFGAQARAHIDLAHPVARPNSEHVIQPPIRRAVSPLRLPHRALRRAGVPQRLLRWPWARTPVCMLVDVEHHTRDVG